MQLLKSFAAAATLLTLSANAATVGKRQSQTCDEGLKNIGVGSDGVHSQACENLTGACLNRADAGTTDIWSVKYCVAAATCDPKTAFLAQCRNSNVANAADIAHLDYNVYASIVGDCAYAKDGCPISSQNYIDFIYGALNEIGSVAYPASGGEAVIEWFVPITNWAATGQYLPYTNFDDWLHYAATN